MLRIALVVQLPGRWSSGRERADQALHSRQAGQPRVPFTLLQPEGDFRVQVRTRSSDDHSLREINRNPAGAAGIGRSSAQTLAGSVPSMLHRSASGAGGRQDPVSLVDLSRPLSRFGTEVRIRVIAAHECPLSRTDHHIFGCGGDARDGLVILLHRLFARPAPVCLYLRTSSRPAHACWAVPPLSADLHTSVHQPDSLRHRLLDVQATCVEQVRIGSLLQWRDLPVRVALVASADVQEDVVVVPRHASF